MLELYPFGCTCQVFYFFYRSSLFVVLFLFLSWCSASPWTAIIRSASQFNWWWWQQCGRVASLSVVDNEAGFVGAESKRSCAQWWKSFLFKDQVLNSDYKQRIITDTYSRELADSWHSINRDYTHWIIIVLCQPAESCTVDTVNGSRWKWGRVVRDGWRLIFIEWCSHPKRIVRLRT